MSRSTTIAALCALIAAPSAAQQAPARPARVDSAVRATLFSRRELRAAGGVGVATVLLLPLDRMIAEEFRDPGPQHTGLLRVGAKTFNVLGDPGSLVLAAGAYGVGRLTRSPRVAGLGLHTTEAIVLSGAITGLVKGVAGRQRPYLDERDADEFALGRGFATGARASFPSGHTTAAFALASAVTAESRRWWPNAPRAVGPVMYGGAGLVGLARMYDDKHWASDVLLGAGIGTLSGLAAVRYNHAHARGRLNRWLGAAPPP